MENLLLLERARQIDFFVGLVFSLAALGICIGELRASLKARKHPSRKGKKPRTGLKTAVFLTVFMLACSVYAIGWNGWRLQQFALDRRENAPVAAQGTVERVQRVSWGKSGVDYRIRFQPEEGEAVTLIVHDSLAQAYALEEGMICRLSWYPRTCALYQVSEAE